MEPDSVQEAKLWRRWVAAFTLGELIGFGALSVVGALVAFSLTGSLDPGFRSLLLYGVAVVGGFGEGAALAWFQLRVLRDALPNLKPARWLKGTALAASFAWACGMLAPTLDDLVGLSATARVIIWVPAGTLILLSIGGAQAWALRGVVTAPHKWIGANVLGWLAGLPWTFVLPALVPEGAPVQVWAITFVAAGTLMGMTTGAVTGAFLLRLEPVTNPGPGGAPAI